MQLATGLNPTGTDSVGRGTGPVAFLDPSLQGQKDRALSLSPSHLPPPGSFPAPLPAALLLPHLSSGFLWSLF